MWSNNKIRFQVSGLRGLRTDDRLLKREVGSVVVPNERDYAAARMRKWEKIEVGSWNSEVGSGNSQAGKLQLLYQTRNQLRP